MSALRIDKDDLLAKIDQLKEFYGEGARTKVVERLINREIDRLFFSSDLPSIFKKAAALVNKYKNTSLLQYEVREVRFNEDKGIVVIFTTISGEPYLLKKETWEKY